MWKKAIISSTVAAAVFSVLGGFYTDYRLEKQKSELSKDLEKFKVELQNKNAQLEVARASYTVLDAQLNQFEVALSRYVQSSRIASENPGSKYIVLTARQWYNDLQERMADLIEAARAQGIDASVEAEVDTFLRPISLNLESVQRLPHVNPLAPKQFQETWKHAIERTKNKIGEARNKLTTPTGN